MLSESRSTGVSHEYDRLLLARDCSPDYLKGLCATYAEKHPVPKDP